MKIKVFSERFRNNDKALNQLKFLKEWPGNNSMFIDSGEVMQVIKSFFVNRQYQWQNNPAIEIIKELQPDVRQGYVSLLRELLVIEKSLPIKISFYDSQIPLKKESYDECLKIIEHVLLKPA